MHEVISILNLDKSKLQKVISKSKQLCEFLPNLIIYDAELSIPSNQLYLAVAMILEARQKCKLTPIWPEELDLMIFGSKVDREKKKVIQDQILNKYYKSVQKCI
jgi:hypothetical protein